MTFAIQLSVGSLLLGLCAMIHLALLVLAVSHLTCIGARFRANISPARRFTVIFLIGLATILTAHTVQIWAWAAAFLALGTTPNFETAFYFATVTYTTLGYGDIAPVVGERVFVTFAAITDLLTFRISTAFLIGIIVRVLPEVFDSRSGSGPKASRPSWRDVTVDQVSLGKHVSDKTLTVTFDGPPLSLFREVAITGLLTLIIAGFYRSWMKTRLRRWYWSAIRIGDQPLEYLAADRRSSWAF